MRVIVIQYFLAKRIKHT